jgi:hypothetical protein
VESPLSSFLLVVVPALPVVVLCAGVLVAGAVVGAGVTVAGMLTVGVVAVVLGVAPGAAVPAPGT